MIFSEQSKLLIAHWEGFQDVKRAEERLAVEMSKYLIRLFDDFRKSERWSSSWHVKYVDEKQLCLWRDNWVENGESLVWIGIEQFKIETVFGEDGTAQLYVWVSDKQAVDLIQELRKTLNNGDNTGEIQGKYTAGQYIIKRTLPKCLPNEIDEFESRIGGAIRLFIEKYISEEKIITEAIESYRKTKKA